MKKIFIISILTILASMAGTVSANVYPEEYLGLPGDNLNLYATMKLFQESETLEGFERDLNDQNSQINNLDLNGDNYVDYISVMDYVDGNVHTIVLRTQLNRNETQDIAVFTVQRFDDGSARIQLIGDEALYGRNYIVEPIYADSQETPNPGYMGSSVVVTTPTPVVVTAYEVAAWPIVRFIYRPGYVLWRSSWSWGYYPSYWNPWRPYYWHTYYGYHSHFNHYYYAHYRYWNHHRYHRYHDFYYSRVRTYSPKVNVRIRQGNYRTTYSRPDLRKRGDELYRNTARRSTGVRSDNSNSRRTNSLKSVRSRSTHNSVSNSGRRTFSDNQSRTRTNSQINRGVESTRKSSTIRSGRSTTNPSQRTNKTESQRSAKRSTSSYRSGTRSSANTNIKRGVQQKSTTIRNNRNAGGSSTRQDYRQPKRTSSVYSNKSATKPKVSSRSSRSGSSYRQPNVSSRSSRSGSSYRQPKVSSRSTKSGSISRPKGSSGSRSSGVSSRSSRSSGSRSSGVSSRSSQSRSSSGSRSGRR